MSPLKAAVDLKKIGVVAIIAVSLASSAFFALRYRKVASQAHSKSAGLESMSKEMLAIKGSYDKIQNSYERLKGEYAELEKKSGRVKSDLDTITADRDNLLQQAKKQIADRNKADELQASIERIKTDMQVLEKEKQEAFDQRSSLQKTIDDLLAKEQQQESSRDQLITENKDLTEAVGQMRERSGIARIVKLNTTLTNDNTFLTQKLKDIESETQRLRQSESALRQEKSALSAELKQALSRYSQAVKLNKQFEKKLVSAPAKCAEISRQHQALIVQTATMHYNLGVFYTRQKEYSRAAAEFEKTIELRPGDAYAHFNLGYLNAEYLGNRARAIEHFEKYIRYAKSTDKDVDWVKKYLLTWQAWNGKEPVQ